MEDDVELTVHHARARIDGDTARVEVTTDRGRVTLRMHRLVLGALGGAIARALWPKAGEDVPGFADAEPQDVPIQPASREPEEEAVGAVHGAAPQDVPVQPASQEPEGESVGAPAGIAPHAIPAQHEASEPDEVLVAFDALWPEGEEPVAPSAGVGPNNIPTQPELGEAEAELASLAGAEPQEDPAREPPEPQRQAVSATPRRKRRS